MRKIHTQTIRMKYHSKCKFIFALMMPVVVLCLLGYPVADSSAEEDYAKWGYWPSSKCELCHSHIFTQHSQSMHSKSFTNPVFQEQYFKELLPQISTDLDLIKEADGCIACHAPITYVNNKSYITSREQVEPEYSGVTCDFCHTVTAFEGENPGSGNYVAGPSVKKYGPFERKGWHHCYGEFQTKSEFCGVCHNAENHFGLEIKSIYTEWKNSRYAEEGIQCQDCHMNVLGFLSAGEPVYESGESIGRVSLIPAQYRERLYTHRFPGAHSRDQVIGSLALKIAVSSIASPGDEITVTVLVDNARTGHKMPSGSADLRLLWLELKAYIGEETIKAIPIAASSVVEGQSAYDVTGQGIFDKDILRRDIPAGNRIYRAIFLDNKGRQTLSSYNATKIIFDNRLDAAEIRKETYRFKIPLEAKDKIFLFATLHYLPYPSIFVERLGLPKAEAFEIAFAKKEIFVH